MLISTKGRYALRVMIELAESGSREEYRRLDLIAASQEISEKYLESIMSLLMKAGLIEGLRGRGGGYRLKREPGEYTVGEILRASDGSLAPVACLECSLEKCSRAENCRTLPVWKKLDSLIQEYLDSVSLEELAKQK